MPSRLFLVTEESLAGEYPFDLRELCISFASFIGDAVEMVVISEAGMRETREHLRRSQDFMRVDHFLPQPKPSSAPMSSAEFIWRSDGRPDWESMWNGFCDLALYGGPPHRGQDSALRAEAGDGRPAEEQWDAVEEMRRGIAETCGLYSEPAQPGWLAITCSSPRMAAWLCACIILENVEARCEGPTLYVPCSPGFQLKDQVKSVITVVAKTNHYWQAHVEQEEAARRRAR
jgi:hypothetical protein